MSVAIAVFVKTPSLSPLKTRLAATIGREKAHEFYHISLGAICTTIQTSAATQYWAVAEQEGMHDDMWQEHARLHTGLGNLGARQHHIYEMLLQNHDSVLLIGSDAPQLSLAIIKQSIEALKNHDFVIGPAYDGGYYLFGGRKATDKSIWENTPWSADNTREVFTQSLPSVPCMLNFLTDIDTQDDLHALHAEMPNDKNVHQLKLLEWMKTL